MKPEHLEALLIDRALGELSPEVAELLEDYLRGDPAAQREADRWMRCVADTAQTMSTAGPLRRPGPSDGADGRRAWRLRIAAAAVLLLVAAIAIPLARLGTQPPSSPAESWAPPWATYDIAYDAARGGFTVAQRGVRP